MDEGGNAHGREKWAQETKGERVNDSHLNVAYVAAGYAYELAIKSIAKADDVLEKPTHSVVQTYANLSEDRQAEIAAAIREHGAGAAEAYFRRVDEMCTHKDRKYWMFEKDMWSGSAGQFRNRGWRIGNRWTGPNSRFDR